MPRAITTTTDRGLGSCAVYIHSVFTTWGRVSHTICLCIINAFPGRHSPIWNINQMRNEAKQDSTGSQAQMRCTVIKHLKQQPQNRDNKLQQIVNCKLQAGNKVWHCGKCMNLCNISKYVCVLPTYTYGHKIRLLHSFAVEILFVFINM